MKIKIEAQVHQITKLFFCASFHHVILLPKCQDKEGRSSRTAKQPSQSHLCIKLKVKMTGANLALRYGCSQNRQCSSNTTHHMLDGKGCRNTRTKTFMT